MIRIKPNTQEEPKKYRIIRFYRNGNHRTIKIVSSLEIAKLHCSDPRTRKDGVYFDGYTEV